MSSGVSALSKDYLDGERHPSGLLSSSACCPEEWIHPSSLPCSVDGGGGRWSDSSGAVGGRGRARHRGGGTAGARRWRSHAVSGPRFGGRWRGLCELSPENFRATPRDALRMRLLLFCS
jgi:hypothetical protein